MINIPEWYRSLVKERIAKYVARGQEQTGIDHKIDTDNRG